MLPKFAAHQAQVPGEKDHRWDAEAMRFQLPLKAVSPQIIADSF
jgi:hypothetical protein